jgi:5-methyltetrahydropteroyltriglutamate--homocysteine methyltransferase
LTATANPLPLLPTTVVGSHGRPAWWWVSAEAILEGRFGTQDITETFDHAVDVAILDQERLGIDVITDGEMRRVAAYAHSLLPRIQGLRSEPSNFRRWGPPQNDMGPVLHVEGPVSAPSGLGVAQDFAYLRAHTTRRTKATCPGALTFAGFCRLAPPYADVWELAQDMAAIVNAELKACVAAGADFVQIDDPTLGVRPREGQDIAGLVNRMVEGVEAKIGLHICFGTGQGRPRAYNRSYRPLFPELLESRVDQFLLEFANREMAEIDLWQEYQPRQELVVGVIDQKAHLIETPEFVAERIRLALRTIPAEKLWISPDCGFATTAYWIAMGKLRAMVEGTAIVRRELTGQ